MHENIRGIPMQIYFIRHAQSQNNHLFDQNGNNQGRFEDPDLTATGVTQTKLLAEHIFSNLSDNSSLDFKDEHNRLGYAFTHLYASPMIRAAKTAWVVAQKIKLPLRILINLHEGGGIFLDENNKAQDLLPGQSKTYFLNHFPGIILDHGITEEGWWNRPFEPYEIRIPRAKNVVKFLIENHKNDDKVVLFSHAGFFNYLLSALLGYEEFENVRFNINNSSISRIDIDPDRLVTKIIYINMVNFLPYDLIT